MIRSRIYLVLCIIGVILPYSQLVPYMIENNGVAIIALFQGAFATRASSFFALDLIVTAFTFFIFLFTEGRQKSYPVYMVWLPLLAVFTVGVSLGFPLFMYFREQQMAKEGEKRK